MSNALEAARRFLERAEDGNAADFVTIGELKAICRALLKQEGVASVSPKGEARSTSKPPAAQGRSA